MNFMNAMQKEINKEKSFTENGAVAYASSGKKALDFSFNLTGYRNAPANQIQSDFEDAWYENPLVAMKMLFWVRDCRGGAGERRIFRECMKWLANNKPEYAKVVLKLVPEYGRYDDWWSLLSTDIKEYVIDCTDEQLEKDILNSNREKPISLLAKWMPSLKASSKETQKNAEILRDGLGMYPSQYRKSLSALRKYLDVVEQKMSAKEWGEINYNTVPSRANLIYNGAFLRNDEERRRKYLSDLASGKGNAKINAGVLYPAEIVHAYSYTNYWDRAVKDYGETLEQLWKNLPQMEISNSLVVRDGSGSMMGRSGEICPLDVATSLAIYMSEHNSSVWKDKFITFSSKPKFVDLSNCKTLHDKIGLANKEAECSNTDIESTMMLILATAIDNKCTQEEMPERIIIISDMQFDSATYPGWGEFSIPSQTLFEKIADTYKAVGYKMPKIVFWNVAAKVNGTIPMQENELGVTLLSGYTVQLMKMVMSDELDPYKALLETINAERYDDVEEAIKPLL